MLGCCPVRATEILKLIFNTAAKMGLLWNPRKHRGIYKDMREVIVPIDNFRGAAGFQILGWVGRQPGCMYSLCQPQSIQRRDFQ